MAEVERDPLSLLADALHEVAGELRESLKDKAGERTILDVFDTIGHQLALLGNAGALTEQGTEIGAIEGHAMILRDVGGDIASNLDDVAEALNSVSTAVEGIGTEIADAIRYLADKLPPSL